MRILARTAAAALLAACVACRGGAARPAAVDTRNDACASCRMPVSDPKLAAELAAPGEEPRFFDDIGCLRDFLARTPGLPRGSVAYVADHRTGEWTPAARAIFSRCPAVETPMGSHLAAHADAASRAADPTASACAPLATEELFGPTGLPGGKKAG
jgi:copper chaperone NosL